MSEENSASRPNTEATSRVDSHQTPPLGDGKTQPSAGKKAADNPASSGLGTAVVNKSGDDTLSV